MRTRLLCILCMCLYGMTPLMAQSDKLIRELEDRRARLQKQMAETEVLLDSTRRTTAGQLNRLALLAGQMEERRRYIVVINQDIETVDREMQAADDRLSRLEESLREKRDRYAASVRYLYRHRSIEEKLMFIFSAKDLAQIYRRLRYVREYADYQRMQGEAILRQQERVNEKKDELARVRQAKQALLAERGREMQALESQEKEQRGLVDALRRKQRSLQNEVARQRKEAARLNSRIDRLVAEEVEKARKRAEAEARREAEERKHLAEPPRQTAAAPPKLDTADRQLSGSFVSNRGKLPMPITGPAVIVSHYGQYAVKGLRNVRLDNKGIDIQGHPGAQARAIFGGKVAAVFSLDGLFNILVRHGAYISVYCNLSSTLVKVGDDVSTLQPLGTVFTNAADGNRTVLHFQLRKETAKLDPELWLDK